MKTQGKKQKQNENITKILICMLKHIKHYMFFSPVSRNLISQTHKLQMDEYNIKKLFYIYKVFI